MGLVGTGDIVDSGNEFVRLPDEARKAAKRVCDDLIKGEWPFHLDRIPPWGQRGKRTKGFELIWHEGLPEGAEVEVRMPLSYSPEKLWRSSDREPKSSDSPAQ